jgi:hypothetical protein
VDVSTFYALFSATCFTLTGLWWSVIERHRHWHTDPAMRRRVGAVYVAFLLPALMGLFAQVGGAKSPGFWWGSVVVYGVIAVVGAVPEIARGLGVTPLQAEATLLILLVALAHGLVWEFMTRPGHEEPS